MVIGPLVALGLVWIGARILPDGVALFSMPDISPFGILRTLLAHLLIFSGSIGLLKEMNFAWRAQMMSGDWYIQITDTRFRWLVPEHTFGPEEPFDIAIAEIERLEISEVQSHDVADPKQFMLHLTEDRKIQLRSYSGVSLPKVAQELSARNVKVIETIV